MYITEQYIMYHLAISLIKTEGYQVIHVDNRNNELWLEKSTRLKSKIIRFYQKEFDWQNHLRKDIMHLFQRIKQTRKAFRGRGVEIYNIYVSTNSPVDDWKQLTKPMMLESKRSVKMKTFYISNQNYIEEQARLLTALSSQIPVINVLPSESTQAVDVNHFKMVVNKEIIERKQQFENIFSYGKPHIRSLLIYLNIFMFIILESNGGSTNIATLIEFGAKYNPAIISGEWWRIVTSMFLHIGFVHLLMNMLALYYLGDVVEKIFGSIRFSIVYFLSGIGGGLTSFALNDSVAAGASGAIFGLFGALLFFGVNYRQLFFQTMGNSVILILFINLIFGFMVPGIDMGAHLGGLLTGFLAASIVHLPYKRNYLMQIGGFLLYCIVIFLLVKIGLS